MVKQLDANLARLANIIARDLGKEVNDTAGAGAAGGLGAGVMAFLGARLKRGVNIVVDAMKLADKVKDADYVITGEGVWIAKPSMVKHRLVLPK